MITDKEVLKFLRKPEKDIEEEVKISTISNYEVLVILEKVIIYIKQKAKKI